MSRTEHEILTVLALCNGHEGEVKITMLAGTGSSAGGQGCLHGLGALLEVAHPADGFGFLDQLAVAAMNHLVVGLPAAAVLGELVSWGKTLLLLSDLTEGWSFR